MHVRLPRFLPRFAPSLLLVLCLTGCGQTGPLFLRMPDVNFPFLPPPISTRMTPVIGVAAGTAMAPVSATAPQLPPAATHAAPAAATRPAPSASLIR